MTSFICLECGVALTRGTEYCKKWHFRQMHKDLDEKTALTNIVESNHELARKRKKVEKSHVEETLKKTKKKPSGTILLLSSMHIFFFYCIFKLLFSMV